MTPALRSRVPIPYSHPVFLHYDRRPDCEAQ